jgi:hypothetical protein
MRPDHAAYFPPGAAASRSSSVTGEGCRKLARGGARALAESPAITSRLPRET